MGETEQTYDQEDKLVLRKHGKWVLMEGDDSESSFDDSFGSSSNESSDSSLDHEMIDDASSSPISPSNGPLYELSELMAHLPIKRGLSKYYQGKSKTFSSLSSLRNLEDLAKKVRPRYKSRDIKSSKSYGGGLGNIVYSPKATISKKSGSRASFFSSLANTRRGFTCVRFARGGFDLRRFNFGKV